MKTSKKSAPTASTPFATTTTAVYSSASTLNDDANAIRSMLRSRLSGSMTHVDVNSTMTDLFAAIEPDPKARVLNSPNESAHTIV